MAKVELNAGVTETATPITRPTEVVVTDTLGRSIKVRKLKPSERSRLSLALGDAAKDQVFFGNAFLAAAVVELDGERIARPSSKLEAEVLMDRLDDEGLEAVGNAYVEHFAVKPLTAEEVDAAKN